MKFTFNRKEFLAAVNIGGSYVSSKNVLPVLEDIKVTINGDKAWIMSYDNENAIKTICPIVSSTVDTGVFCINKKKIYNYISLLDDEVFSIEITEESIPSGGKRINAIISTPNGTIVFPCDDPEIYPELKNEKGIDSITIPSDILSYWINTASPFLGEITLKPILGCMNFIIKEGRINIFVTDGFKLYHDYIKIEDDSIDTSFSIQKKSLNGIVMALKKEDNITIKNGKNNLIFICDNTVILVRKIEANMIDFFKLLGYKKKYSIPVKKRNLLKILQKATSIQENTKSGLVNIHFNDEGIIFSSENLDGNIKMNETIKVEGATELSQNFNISYLATAISGLSDEDILLCPTGDKTPMYIKNANSDTEITMNSPFIS
jgi:DNA polymerase III sliding clamp (beta) subunit (PCNA family)